MGLYRLVLLLVAVLLASVDPATSSSHSQVMTPGTRAQPLEIDAPTKRLQRAPSTDEGAVEERGWVSGKIPGVDKIAYALKSSKTKEVEALLKADESVIGAFKKLKLNAVPVGTDGVVEATKVVEFFSSQNFKVWYKYATKTNPKDPQGAMVETLTSLFGEKNLATMILLGKDSRRSRSMAKKLETAQFNAWFKNGKRPDGVLVDMLGVQFRDIHRYPRAKYIWSDYNTYFTNKVKNY